MARRTSDRAVLQLGPGEQNDRTALPLLDERLLNDEPESSILLIKNQNAKEESLNYAVVERKKTDNGNLIDVWEEEKFGRRVILESFQQSSDFLTIRSSHDNLNPEKDEKSNKKIGHKSSTS